METQSADGWGWVGITTDQTDYGGGERQGGEKALGRNHAGGTPLRIAGTAGTLTNGSRTGDSR